MTSDVPRRLHHAAIVVEAAALGAAARRRRRCSSRSSAAARPEPPPCWRSPASRRASLMGYVRWRTTTYWLDDVALHYRSGVFTPDERVVPRARVQAVDTATGLLQRLFGVVELRVQVPGAADKDEVVLSAVTHEEVARLRRALGQPAPAAPDERVALRPARTCCSPRSPARRSAPRCRRSRATYALADNVIDVAGRRGVGRAPRHGARDRGRRCGRARRVATCCRSSPQSSCSPASRSSVTRRCCASAAGCLLGAR